MMDGLGTNIFTYTGSGQLRTEDGPFASDTITNAYWNRMRTNLTLLQPAGVWTNAFTYDGMNLLYSVASPAGTFTYHYYEEPSTRLNQLSLPGGAYVDNQFDSMSRLTSTYLYGSSGALDGHLYNYDQENQRTNEVRADSSTVDYFYDKIGQLVTADSSVPSEDRGYTYDTAWNLNYRTNNGSLSTFIVNQKNELTTAFGTGDSYDSNGNLTALGTHKVLVYDDENRLIQWFSYRLGFSTPTNDDLRCDFMYDGLGRLRKKLEYAMACPMQATNPPPDSVAQQQQEESGGGGNGCVWTLTNEVHYVYDGWRVIQERDGNNTPTVSYTRGNDLSVSLEGAGGIGGLLARSSGYSSGNWTSHADYYADGNGNVTSLINSNQAVVASYRYDPFGNIISKSGSLADANVYRFSSKEVHVNSGMYYYGFRFYDPNLQRWSNRDPIGESGGINLYSCVRNKPVSQTDPMGLCNDLGSLMGMAGPGMADYAHSSNFDNLRSALGSAQESGYPADKVVSAPGDTAFREASAKQAKEVMQAYNILGLFAAAEGLLASAAALDYLSGLSLSEMLDVLYPNAASLGAREYAQAMAGVQMPKGFSGVAVDMLSVGANGYALAHGGTGLCQGVSGNPAGALADVYISYNTRPDYGGPISFFLTGASFSYDWSSKINSIPSTVSY